MQRWLRKAGLAPPPAVRIRCLDDRRAREAHDVWQMDAVECLTLADGSGACWLRLTDECSGAILATQPFPLFRWAQVPVGQTQEAIRRCFERYGCPGIFRVDNGHPWGKPGGLPSALCLWLVGLGVGMHFNDPHRPEQNGVMENSQGVSQRWVEPGRCANFAEFCRRVEEEDINQRERYPAINGQSRWQAYPWLRRSGRGYCRLWEEMVWDLQQALAFLGRFRVRRKVSCAGQVSLYHRLIRAVPKNQAVAGYAGTLVDVGFDPATSEGVIWTSQGPELSRQPAAQFTREGIITLQIDNRERG